MPRDPVCGHYVDKSTPFKQEYEGDTYYFCCLDCMEEYEFEFDNCEAVDEEPIDLRER